MRAELPPQPVDDAETVSRRRASAMQAVLHGGEVICVQMISAGSNLFDRLGPFSAILVDEVAQSTELNVIVSPTIPRVFAWPCLSVCLLNAIAGLAITHVFA